MEKNKKRKNTYKVNVYLGKELYNQFKIMGEFFGLSVSQVARMILNTGVQLEKMMEEKGVFKNGTKE